MTSTQDQLEIDFDESESSLGTSTQEVDSSTVDGSNPNNKKRDSDVAISKNETQSVNRVKFIAVSVLVLSAIGVALTIYYYVKNSETSTFVDSYTFDSQKVLEAIGTSIGNNLGALDSFATNAVSFAAATNQTFPYVTLPDFALKASKVRSLSDGLYISFQPVIQSNQRFAWEVYAMNNEGWVNDTKRMQETDKYYYGNVSYGLPNPTQIFNYTGPMPYDKSKYKKRNCLIVVLEKQKS